MTEQEELEFRRGLAAGDGEAVEGVESKQGVYVPGKYNPGMVPDHRGQAPGSRTSIINGGSYADMARDLPPLADIAFQLRGTGGPTGYAPTEPQVITDEMLPGGIPQGYERITTNSETEPMAPSPEGPPGVAPPGAAPGVSSGSAPPTTTPITELDEAWIADLMASGLGDLPEKIIRPASAPTPTVRTGTRSTPRIFFGG